MKTKREISIKKNDVIELKIEDVSLSGSGIGHYNGIAVFVPGCAAGDNVLAKIIKVKSSYLIGKTEKILTESSCRTVPDCSIYARCGGCAFRHINYETELKIKQKHVKDCLERLGGFKNLNFETIKGAKTVLNYRNKAQIPVGCNSDGSLISGFFSAHSHNIINCEKCFLHPKEFDEITAFIKKFMALHNISAYNESLCSGTIRHIYLRASQNCAEIMLCLVVNKTKLLHQDEFIKEITKKFKNIKSIILNFNLKDTNVITGKNYKTIFGKDYLSDSLCGCNFKISPASFYQVNHAQTEILYNLAKEALCLKKSDVILDLYCGIGTIGITMAENVKKVIGVEIVPEAIENAKENARLNHLTNTEFFCGDSSKVLSKFLKNEFSANVVIVDPPRKGCDEQAIDDILKIYPEKILYISCNPATLAKDLKKICADGCYEIKRVIPVDLFPRTSHVETIALLMRIN